MSKDERFESNVHFGAPYKLVCIACGWTGEGDGNAHVTPEDPLPLTEFRCPTCGPLEVNLPALNVGSNRALKRAMKRRAGQVPQTVRGRPLGQR